MTTFTRNTIYLLLKLCIRSIILHIHTHNNIHTHIYAHTNTHACTCISTRSRSRTQWHLACLRDLSCLSRVLLICRCGCGPLNVEAGGRSHGRTWQPWRCVCMCVCVCVCVCAHACKLMCVCACLCVSLGVEKGSQRSSHWRSWWFACLDQVFFLQFVVSLL